jgi:hypothetical protein
VPYFARRPRRDRVGSFAGASAAVSARNRPRASRTSAFGETPLARAAATSFASSCGSSGNVSVMNTFIMPPAAWAESPRCAYALSGCRRRYFRPPSLPWMGYGTRCSKKASKYFLFSSLRVTTVTRYARPLQNAQVSLFCHYRPVKNSEIEGNQVRSKTAASYWLTRGYDLFSSACRNGKKGFQDRRIQPLCHSSAFYLTGFVAGPAR